MGVGLTRTPMLFFVGNTWIPAWLSAALGSSTSKIATSSIAAIKSSPIVRLTPRSKFNKELKRKSKALSASEAAPES
jgi:hypothetical protein